MQPEEEAKYEVHLSRGDPTFSGAASAAVGPQNPNLVWVKSLWVQAPGLGGLQSEGWVRLLAGERATVVSASSLTRLWLSEGLTEKASSAHCPPGFGA